MGQKKCLFTAILVCLLCFVLGSTAGGAPIQSVETAKAFIQALNQGDRSRAKALVRSKARINKKYWNGSAFDVRSEDLTRFIEQSVSSETRFSIGESSPPNETDVVIKGRVSDYATKLKGIEGGILYSAQFVIENGKITEVDYKEYGEASAQFAKNDTGMIGVRITSENGKYLVKECFSGGPADTAGIKVDDIFERVDGVKVVDMPHGLDEVLYRVRGAVGTSVRLSINRNGIVKDFEIERRK